MDLYYDKVTGTYGALSEIVAVINAPEVGLDYEVEDLGFYAEAHGKPIEVATEDKGYNGWSNYPTWAVKLWIDNDQGSYNYWRDIAREHMENTPDLTADERRNVTYSLASALEDQHGNWHDQLGLNPRTATMYDDLMGYALGQVNWREIAESLISEVQEEDAYKAEHSNG